MSAGEEEKHAYPHVYVTDYAPPEVLSNKLRHQTGLVVEEQAWMVNGSAVDVYSLGVILYMILTSSKSPFQCTCMRDATDNLEDFRACFKWRIEAMISDGQAEWVSRSIGSVQSHTGSVWSYLLLLKGYVKTCGVLQAAEQLVVTRQEIRVFCFCIC